LTAVLVWRIMSLRPKPRIMTVFRNVAALMLCFTLFHPLALNA
jgi:hypothetical protein